MINEETLKLPLDEFLLSYNVGDLQKYIESLDKKLAVESQHAEIVVDETTYEELEILDEESQIEALQCEINERMASYSEILLQERVFLVVNLGIPKLLLKMAQEKSNLIRTEIEQEAECLSAIEFLEYLEKLCEI